MIPDRKGPSSSPEQELHSPQWPNYNLLPYLGNSHIQLPVVFADNAHLPRQARRITCTCAFQILNLGEDLSTLFRFDAETELRLQRTWEEDSFAFVGSDGF